MQEMHVNEEMLKQSMNTAEEIHHDEIHSLLIQYLKKQVLPTFSYPRFYTSEVKNMTKNPHDEVKTYSTTKYT